MGRLMGGGRVWERLGAMRTLVITNDFPPRAGGIQQFVHSLATRQPADEIVVYASSHEGCKAFDAAQSFPVVRYPLYPMIPEPRVVRTARELIRSERCDRVWFGAAAPLGLMAGSLGGSVERCVASTHGHEPGWARLPAARQMLRAVGQRNDVVTYVSNAMRRGVEGVLGPVTELQHLPSGVDTSVFVPGIGDEVRMRHGLVDRPVVVCVSRLVRRKGQDRLLQALPAIKSSIPEVALLIVGDGPARSRLEAQTRALGLESSVVFTGPVPWAELPAHYAAGDVFAMPARTRLGGLDVEGLGIVYLEAAAAGLPVVAGRSGGAPDAVIDGQTGHVIDGADPGKVANAIVDLLAHPEKASAMGAAGRRWVKAEWEWTVLAERLGTLLAGP